jgi:transposase InsO family protein
LRGLRAIRDFALQNRDQPLARKKGLVQNLRINTRNKTPENKRHALTAFPGLPMPHRLQSRHAHDYQDEQD